MCRLTNALVLLILYAFAAVAQLVECVLGKDEVMGSSPISSSVVSSVPLRGVLRRRQIGRPQMVGNDSGVRGIAD